MSPSRSIPDALFAALARWAKAGSHSRGRSLRSETRAARRRMALPAIEGIDMAGGLKRVAGNKRLYRSLLEQFAVKQSDAGSQIVEALANRRSRMAERLAHTVKGVAGNIGIWIVQSGGRRRSRAPSARRIRSVPTLCDLESSLLPQVAAHPTRLWASLLR